MVVGWGAGQAQRVEGGRLSSDRALKKALLVTASTERWESP